jgi:putative cell wall-binding protein
MKRNISLILALVIIFIFVFQTFAFANDASTYNNNTLSTSTSFTISSAGKAVVYYEYFGYTGIATGARIEIILEKRSFLLFWNEVLTDTITVSGENCADALVCHLTEKGTYRCTVTYTVSGTAGADDVITFQDTASW